MTSYLALALILSQAQVNAANQAYTIGAPYGEGNTLQAIIWQESSFCQQKRLRWSVGCAGTKRRTVRYIYDPAATRLRLEQDNEYSIKAGLSILLYCRDNTAGWSEMVYCFHYGLPAEEAQTSEYQIVIDPYVKAIKAKLKELQSVPETKD